MIWIYNTHLANLGFQQIHSVGNPPKMKSHTEQEISIHVNLVKKTMPVSDDMWRTIAEETDKDETLHQLKTNIINGSIAALSARTFNT